MGFDIEEAKLLCTNWCKTCGFDYCSGYTLGKSWFGDERIYHKVTIFSDNSVLLEKYGLSEDAAWLEVLQKLTEGFDWWTDGRFIHVEAISEDELRKMLSDAQRDD